MRLSRRTRLAGVALIAAGSLTLAACGGGSDDKAVAETDSVITVYGTNPQNPLIPTATNEVGGGDPLDNLFSGLVAYNTDGSVTNEVAESIEPDADNKVWTVKIKDGQKFTDGSAVTAESFVKAWNYGANPANKQLNNYFFYPIKGTDDVGNTARGCQDGLGPEGRRRQDVHDHAEGRESDFPLRLGYSAYFPVPDSAYDSAGKITKAYGERPIGNGPYKLTKTGLGAQQADRARAEPGLQGHPQAEERRTGLQVLRRWWHGRGIHRRPVGQPRRPRPGAAERADHVRDATPRSRPTTSPARASRPSRSRSASRTSSGRGGRPASCGHLDGDQPPRDHREDLQQRSYACQGLHFARARRLDRQGRRQRGPEVQRRRGQGQVGRG